MVLAGGRGGCSPPKQMEVEEKLLPPGE